MTAAALTVAFCASCAAIYFVGTYAWRRLTAGPVPPRWEEAFRIVWADVLGMRWEARPRVIWITGRRLDCNEGRGWISGGRCIGGFAGATSVTVAWREGDPLYVTGFAHELVHAARLRVAPSDDEATAHASPEFIVAVGRATAALRAWHEKGNP